MPKRIQIKLSPSQAADDHLIRQRAAQAAGKSLSQISGYQIVKRSLDARSKHAAIILTLDLFIDEPFQDRILQTIQWKDVSKADKRVLIVGSGPAGLFAALKCIELGVQPLLLERGKDVRARRRDLALLNKEGILNPESNYCFGEGGAGTYSDGKLYTRSTKRGDVSRILAILAQFGAPEHILYESHPHIGTNKLPRIVSAIRDHIKDCGGNLFFEQKVVDLKIDGDQVRGVITSQGESIEGDGVLLATGHSARDIFELLFRRGIQIELKPFALGVRVEHPQALIDQIQYGQSLQAEKHLDGSAPSSPHVHSHLPPASYSLVQPVGDRSVFSFCMCPGGIIAPASTSPGELVVNGWSPSRRNNPFANSGVVVPVGLGDLLDFKKYGPLAGVYFQQMAERRAFDLGGGNMVAPAQRLTDFIRNKISSTLPPCSYLPGVRSAPLDQALPKFVTRSLQQAFTGFGKKLKGYCTEEAIVVATESRTSSPVRIPRLPHVLEHPQIKNLFPCGEGAGYAGGIMSAAMDGERVAASMISKKWI